MMDYGQFRCRKARNGNLIIEDKRRNRAIYNVCSKKVTFNKGVPQNVINYFVKYFK